MGIGSVRPRTRRTRTCARVRFPRTVRNADSATEQRRRRGPRRAHPLRLACPRSLGSARHGRGPTVNDFELLGPLPTGTTVLEASAGTGKTFTIAALVARYVAEGRARLDELLVVTFGRAATQELRDRVRERLVSARDGLVDIAAARTSDDALLRHLADADDAEVSARRARLVTALASFDAATVVTIHQF